LKYVSLDLETTGLDPDTCDLLEIGAVIEDTDKPEVPLADLPQFHRYFLPPREGKTYRGQPIAFAMHSKILEYIGKAGGAAEDVISVNQVAVQLSDFLKDNGFVFKHGRITVNVAGKNVSWDVDFLRKNSNVSRHVNFRSRVLDPAILYWQPEDDKLPGLSECKRRAGLPEEVAHTAIEDALDVIQLLRHRTHA
jgi:DNA polymerase III epsilon subunit-like protein